MKKELIVFSIPTVDGRITAAIDMFIRGCERESNNPRVPWEFTTNIIEGYRPTELARNRLVQLFLKIPEASRLFFLDADVKPPMEAASLLRLQSDIVAGVYPVWGCDDKGQEPFCKWTAYEKGPGSKFIYVDIAGKTEPFYADGAATGCMVIRRRVLEDPRMNLGRDYINSITNEPGEQEEDAPPPIFRWPRYPNGKTMATDDFDFCWRAKQIGYTLKIDPNVKCGHVKTLDLTSVIRYRENGMREVLERAAA